MEQTAARVIDLAEFRRLREARREPAGIPSGSPLAVVWMPVWIWLPVWPGARGV